MAAVRCQSNTESRGECLVNEVSPVKSIRDAFLPNPQLTSFIRECPKQIEGKAALVLSIALDDCDISTSKLTRPCLSSRPQ